MDSKMETPLKSAVSRKTVELEKLQKQLMERVNQPELYSFLKLKAKKDKRHISSDIWCAFKSRSTVNL
ncbi:hypothetical protein SAMN05444682_11728 [Parapedobacter indicus]|uniref:Uncharacterized protein n=1 Tax=Parapedobacter indicus TaxID=1477437 RepID=A0A1I3VJK1_9SPHI|nr:hypothetical protein CLV26_11720 [Parapedobacter indicus]SFJ95163.1 hypothetical protein SAMN05444682_11728 [Parapedobacter indicus]